MFGNNNQNQSLGDVSNVSLPSSLPAATPAFPNDQANTDEPAAVPAAPAQDLTMPEISEHATANLQANTGSGNIGDLAALKRQALSQLTPLVGHLDQSPEEKFRTTMMMIQASDDQTLIPEAYQAAQAISDEKAKAQALLDVVNEINYFSQKNQ